ncbi:TPA: hypothetical protein RSW55_000070 [Vibrio vulnificus]|nr:hypothetical protein [Vibrio vulnificus]
MYKSSVLSMIGIPFSGDDINVSLLLMAILKKRAKLSGEDETERLLEPDYVSGFYPKIIGKEIKELNSRHLTQAEKKIMSDAIDYILDIIPEWYCFFYSFDFCIKAGTGKEKSYSHPQIPQTYVVNEKIIASGNIVKLSEMIIHEVSHVWFGLICELNDFQTLNSREDYVLPSGIKGRNPRGLILALYYAIPVAIFYRKIGNNEQVEQLISYANGIISSYDVFSKELTDTGKDLIQKAKLIICSMENGYENNFA